MTGKKTLLQGEKHMVGSWGWLLVELSTPYCKGLPIGCLNLFNNTVTSFPQSKEGSERERE